MRSPLCFGFDTEAALILLLVVPVMSAPPLCLVVYHTLHTDTHLCLLKERAGEGERGGRKTRHRDGAVYSPVLFFLEWCGPQAAGTFVVHPSSSSSVFSDC